MFELGDHELNGERKPGSGEDLLMDLIQDLLDGSAFALPISTSSKEVRLLDILFTGVDRGFRHAPHFTKTAAVSLILLSCAVVGVSIGPATSARSENPLLSAYPEKSSESSNQPGQASDIGDGLVESRPDFGGIHRLRRHLTARVRSRETAIREARR